MSNIFFIVCNQLSTLKRFGSWLVITGGERWTLHLTPKSSEVLQKPTTVSQHRSKNFIKVQSFCKNCTTLYITFKKERLTLKYIFILFFKSSYLILRNGIRGKLLKSDFIYKQMLFRFDGVVKYYFTFYKTVLDNAFLV